MGNHTDLGEVEIARYLFNKYKDCAVTFDGLRLLARRGLARGNNKTIVKFGLERVIKKNCRRDLYDGNDALDEKRFISDAEFRAVMRYGNGNDVLWC